MTCGSVLGEDPSVETAFPHGRDFVVQLSRNAEPGRNRLMGRVAHVDSGRSRRFGSCEEMIEFFARVIREEEDFPGEENPGRSDPDCIGETR
jgi:hypothetical protein